MPLPSRQSRIHGLWSTLLIAATLIGLSGQSATAATDTTPPVWRKLPTTSVPVGASLWQVSDVCAGVTYSIKATIDFQAADPESGIAYYEWESSDGWAGETVQPRIVGAIAQSGDHACGGGANVVDIWATNNAGLISPFFTWNGERRLSVREDTSPEVAYTGAWSASNCACFVGGTVRKTTAANSAATLTHSFPTAQALALVMSKAPDRGQAKILVDGVQVATVDTYAPSAVNGTVVWRTTLTPGRHVIKVVNLGTPGRSRIDVDAFAMVTKA